MVPFALLASGLPCTFRALGAIYEMIACKLLVWRKMRWNLDIIARTFGSQGRLIRSKIPDVAPVRGVLLYHYKAWG